jgi:ABC-2 type transport system ATP-binding protein
MRSAATFRNVFKKFEGKSILKNLNFEVESNKSYALIGNNGCGKSTTIHILCNLLAVDSGQVEVFGEKLGPNFISYKKRLGIVLNKPYYIESFTIQNYLRFIGKFQEVPTIQIENRIDTILDFFQLTEKKGKRISTLSNGEKVKVSIMSSLIHNPDFLILDEPFVNLDINTIQSLTEILRSFRGKKTIFVTSHSLDLVVDLCDHFLIMEKGSLLEEIRNKDNTSTHELKEKIKSHLISSDHSIEQIDWLK